MSHTEWQIDDETLVFPILIMDKQETCVPTYIVSRLFYPSVEECQRHITPECFKALSVIEHGSVSYGIAKRFDFPLPQKLRYT